MTHRSFAERAAELVSRMTLEEKLTQLDHKAGAIPRLGVAAYDYWSEGLHGVARSGDATVFPTAIGLATSWNEDLVRRTAAATKRALTPTKRERACLTGRLPSTWRVTRAGAGRRKPMGRILS